MRMIEIAALPNGAHRNQTFNGSLPIGWAVVPENLETANFPFGEVTVECINELTTVTGWIAGEMPEPAVVPEPEFAPSEAEDTAAMLIDHEYRLTLLELGVFDN